MNYEPPVVMRPSSRIPVSRPWLTLAENELVFRVMESGQLTFGDACREFERELAKRLDVAHVITTTSGTTALHLALEAANLGPGDEVLVPDVTFVATANAVCQTGARPILVDINPYTWCIDPVCIPPRVTPRTRAIIPVSLYGVPCAMTAIRAIADYHGLVVIEDAAEGLGGVYAEGTNLNKPIGTCSLAGTFSFYGNKIITTGEGGAVVTNDESLATRLRHLRGQAMAPDRRYYHDEVGFNYRMTELQAAIGVAQLSHLDSTLARRRMVVDRYARLLTGVVHAHPCTYPEAAPWLYTAEFPHETRDALADYLLSNDVETRPVFVPLHRLPMWRDQGDDSTFPVASRIGDRGLSLPTYPELPLEAVDYICDLITHHLSRGV